MFKNIYYLVVSNIWFVCDLFCKAINGGKNYIWKIILILACTVYVLCMEKDQFDSAKA